MTRRPWIIAGVLIALVAAAGAIHVGLDRRPIKVGVLHAMTGTMAFSERSLVAATRMAIGQINAAGGVLGRPIEAIYADGESDPLVFAREAERLISEERVSTIFGCWTSACRRTLRPVIERLDHLLFYPLQYEGLEVSPHIVHLGATPNQQIIPALKWAFGSHKKRIFLVGSDYVFPRVAHRIIGDFVEKWRGEIVGEAYVLLLGHQDVAPIVEEIVATRPDVILNTINGGANVAFFEKLREAGITPDAIPTISFSITESELKNMGTTSLAGDYASWNYFQSIQSEENRSFVSSFRELFGQDGVLGDPMEAAYSGVHLWARAVEAAGSSDVAEIRANVGNIGFRGPGGMTYIEGEDLHVWKKTRIGRILGDGQFEIVWESDNPIRPEPYPSHRSREEWDEFLRSLYEGWGERWYNPGPDAG
jgi:urea transport system substrate-binding protein